MCEKKSKAYEGVFCLGNKMFQDHQGRWETAEVHKRTLECEIFESCYLLFLLFDSQFQKKSSEDFQYFVTIGIDFRNCQVSKFCDGKQSVQEKFHFILK